MKTFPFRVNESDNRKEFLTSFLPEAIASIDVVARPDWGEMTAQHMVEHLAWVFDLSTGRAQITCDIPDGMRGMLKPWLNDDQPSPRNLRNPKLPLLPGPLKYPSMPAATAAFAESLDAFLRQEEANPQFNGVHPLLGPLTVHQWERFHFKHGFHHLLQFRLVDDAADGTR